MVLFTFLRQNIVRLPAPFAPSVCQSDLQCQSGGLQGFGCHDTPVRVHEHPVQTDSSTARSSGALRAQPAPRTAAADQSSSRKSSRLSQVRLKRGVCLLIRALGFEPPRPPTPSLLCSDLCEVLSRIEALLWLVTDAQRCPLVRAAYLGVADALRGVCSETFLSKLSETVTRDLRTPQEELQVCDKHLLKHSYVKKNLLNSKKYINKRRRGNHLHAAKVLSRNVAFTEHLF